MKNRIYQTLTKAEMQVMNILWDIEGGATVAAVVAGYPEPQPAYTTIATFLTILEKKGFVSRNKAKVGKNYLYTPLVTREEYTARAMNEVKDSLFGGSARHLVNFFVNEKMLTRDDIEELLKMMEE